MGKKVPLLKKLSKQVTGAAYCKVEWLNW